MKKEMNDKLQAITARLIDQHAARIIVPPYEDAAGFWFGGGNMVEAPDGDLYLVGRYRNHGDSRTGLEKGARGLELSVLKSSDRGSTFEHFYTFTKNDLSTATSRVLSIEGAALRLDTSGAELFVSTEKVDVSYPPSVEEFQKPGTGVWSIDRLSADSIEGLKVAPLQPFLSFDLPEYLHVKDPAVHQTASGDTVLIFCHHPFNWSSSNAGYCVRRGGETQFSQPDFSFFSRGATWDVAVSRITDLLTLPAEVVGSAEPVQAVFYDGAECMRPHDQNPMGVKRPRGYSCEEIAGLASYSGERIREIRRISTVFPLFTSPWGTGCSRYIHTCATADGVYATWQQSQPSGAQPLVMRYLSWEEIREEARRN
ncbi:MAG: exo-alpha-sialidase [Planctomycetota bacterium]